MKLFVLGASGKTGGALVTQALARGHTITAFGRSPFGSESAKVDNIFGNPTRAAEIADALPGHDAVVSVLGTRGIGATSLLEDSSRATIAAMRMARVRRFIVQSSALLDPNIGFAGSFAGRTFLRHHSRDQRAMERLVTASNLDWTVLRPPRMKDSAPAGRSRAIVGEPTDSNGMLISKEEVARVILDTVENGSHIREIVHLRGAHR
jgi:putative NADH-flavin reductase